MTVKINRYEILDNGIKGKRIYDYLIGENIAYLETSNEELNEKLAEVVLNILNNHEGLK